MTTPGDVNHSARSAGFSGPDRPLPSTVTNPARFARLPSPTMTSRKMRSRGQLATPSNCAVRCTGATARQRDRLAIAPGKTYDDDDDDDARFDSSDLSDLDDLDDEWEAEGLWYAT